MVDALILAGGSGTRLWPASLPHHPKQFLDFGEGSLLSLTVTRAAASVDGRILIVTAADHRDAVLADLAHHPALERVTVLGEPVGRNTLPAIALGVRYLNQINEGDDDAVTVVMPADHRITAVDRFAGDLASAVSAARAGYLVTFGIAPGHAATGYGYIETGEALAAGRPAGAPAAYSVAAFREKPDAATAGEYASSGKHFWNAGIFAFANSTFEAELAAHAPQTAAAVADLGAVDPADPCPVEVYAAIPATSIDYGVMEHTGRAAVVPASFDWTDIGSWDELASLELPDLQSGGVVADIESSGNYVFSDLPVALCGVSDLTVVVKNGAVLVCGRGRSQLVRRASELAEAAAHAGGGGSE